MPKDVRWHIGKEGTTSTSLDAGPYRAYFYWIIDEMLDSSADYSLEELQAEIHRRKLSGEEVTPFVEAMRRLTRL